jgi:hypothetical protein
VPKELDIGITSQPDMVAGSEASFDYRAHVS